MEKSAVLAILDGFGLSSSSEGNAVVSAKTPCISQLLGSYPKTLLSASAEAVGLPFGEMGNSEVGHLNLGTGRVAMQDLPRINKAIEDGSFFQNKTLLMASDHAIKFNSSIHLVGLASSGGVHSHIDHLFSLMDFFKKCNNKEIYIHMITDGRDTPAKVALEYLTKLEEKIKKIGFGRIASVSGRYYAMDRDKHWERTEKAYKTMTGKTNKIALSASKAINEAYNQAETDEFINPTLIKDERPIAENDAVIFFNFRADRMKQIWHTFTSSKELKNTFFISFTSYGQEPTPLCKVAFFAEEIKNQLAQVIEEHNLTQLHAAESEKYAHVTYFFNGGVEKPFKEESRILVPSPSVATYDLKPEMSARELTQKFCLNLSKHDFGVINFANADMVGHTGNFKAAVKAIETLDKCLINLIDACFKNNKILLITADHGNAEAMIDFETKKLNKEHTVNPVFFILVDKAKKKSEKIFRKEDFISFASLTPTGLIADVTPTILEIMELQKPKEMTGMSLLNQFD